LVPPLSAGAFLILILSIKVCILLAQLFFQGVILFDEVLNGSGESLKLSLKDRRAWFVSLSVASGCHRASEHHATLCSGGDSMAYKSQFPTDGAN